MQANQLRIEQPVSRMAAGLQSGAERRWLSKYHPEPLHRFMNHEVRCLSPRLRSIVSYQPWFFEQLLFI